MIWTKQRIGGFTEELRRALRLIEGKKLKTISEMVKEGRELNLMLFSLNFGKNF